MVRPAYQPRDVAFNKDGEESEVTQIDGFLASPSLDRPSLAKQTSQGLLHLLLETNTHSVPYSSFGWDLELNPEMGSPSAKITSLKSISASENQAYSLSR